MGEKATTQYSSWLKKTKEEVRHKEMSMFQVSASLSLQILPRQRNPAELEQIQSEPSHPRKNVFGII